jgi:hypothetical protein
VIRSTDRIEAGGSMNRSLNRVMVGVAGLAVLGMTATLAGAQTDSPFDGTWKYNTASRFGDKWKPYVYIVDSNSYTCSSCRPAYTVKPDGSDQKVKGLDGDTSAVTLTATSVTIVIKLKSKTLESVKYSVSADGKTATVDQTDYYGANPVITKYTLARVAAAAHPLSGTWTVSKLDGVSDAGILQTMGMTDDGFTLSANGLSYDAKFDGRKYPIANDPFNTLVKLKKLSPTEVVESDYVNGKLVETTQLSVDADGQHIHVVESALRTGGVKRYTLDKQP